MVVEEPNLDSSKPAVRRKGHFSHGHQALQFWGSAVGQSPFKLNNLGHISGGGVLYLTDFR